MKNTQLSDRGFGFTFAGLGVFISALGWLFSGQLIFWALYIAIGFAVLAAIKPGLLMPLNRFWSWIAPKIASVNNTIVLGLVFYVLITPMALMMRLFGRDPMHRSITGKASTYWSLVRRRADAESFSDQF
jgi:Saxitoxin biosynthesis operon protein SxtJ